MATHLENTAPWIHPGFEVTEVDEVTGKTNTYRVIAVASVEEFRPAAHTSRLVSQPVRYGLFGDILDATDETTVTYCGSADRVG